MDSNSINKNIDIEEGYINVPAGKVWFKIVGKNQSGIPLLVVHGGPGVSHDYLEPLEALAVERPVIFYDQLGCGRSNRPDNNSLWSVERYAEELNQIKQALNLDKFHFLGQSWGAALVTDYMLTYNPTGVQSVIYSGPLLSTPRWVHDQKNYIKSLPDDVRATIEKCEANSDFENPDYQSAVMEFYKKHLCRLENWPDCLNRAFEHLNFSIYYYMWGPSEFTVTGVLKDYERTEILKEIQKPVLFTCGRYDEATPETVEFYSKNLPGSEFYIFEDASHNHHLEKPEEFLNLISKFMKSREV